MKKIFFILICCLFFQLTKAQSCDTIILYDGTIYTGVIKVIGRRIIKFTNCDVKGKPNMVVNREYVKRTNYTNYLFQLEKTQGCDTIILNDGTVFTGVIKGISGKTVTFVNCDVNGKPIIFIYRRDIKKASYTNYLKKVEPLKKDRIEEIIAEQSTINKKSNDRKSDTINSWHIGIIPYQLLTRSSALYVRYDFKKMSLEYRPSYTYATNINQQQIFPVFFYYDNFYFQGINNSLILYFPTHKATKIGLMLSYKHWWHGIKSIDSDNSEFSGKADSYYLKENRSTVMNGFGAGLEFSYQRVNRKHFDANFFWNASLTYFVSHSYVYSGSESSQFVGNPNYPQKTYPYTETKGRTYFNVTCGFKLGYKKSKH